MLYIKHIVLTRLGTDSGAADDGKRALARLKLHLKRQRLKRQRLWGRGPVRGGCGELGEGRG